VRGADPNEKDKRSQTPLILASGAGHEQIMRILLSNGADVNLADREGDTPFMYAVGNKHFGAAGFLIDKGANINAVNEEGMTALAKAVDRGSPEAVKFLIARGADVNETGIGGERKGATPLFLAALKGNLELAKMLVEKGANVDGAGSSGQVPLIPAAGGAHLELLKYLLEMGARVDQRDMKGRTAIWAASNPVIIKILLDHGASISARDNAGETGLVAAAFNNETGGVKVRLENGADPNSRGRTGWNQLHDDEYFEHEGHNGQWTPLMYAAKADNVEMAQLLLDHGADPALKDEEGDSAWMIAELKNSKKVSALLKDWKGAPKAAPEGESKKKSDIDEPAYHQAEDSALFGVVIGVEKYPNLPAAIYAERDAAAFKRHLLALGAPERNIVYLTGQSASHAGIKKNVEAWLPKNVPKDATVFVYYSGHGAPDVKSGRAFLLPYDGDAAFLDETAYPVKRLYEKLGALKAKRVVVVLDACFSGAGGRSVLPSGTRPLVTNVDVGAPDLGKIATLAASGGEEITGVEESQGHGLFTYYLLKGLNGGAAAEGHVTLQSLYDYASPKVRDGARRQNRDQTPTLQGGQAEKIYQLR
jgi:ankyrin repeat protein